MPCTGCPKGQYTDTTGNTACLTCSWPGTTFTTGSTSCTGFTLAAPPSLNLAVLVITLTLLVGCSAFLKGDALAFIAMVAGPNLDLLSDILYISSVVFYSKILLAAAIITFSIPILFFGYVLYSLEAAPYCFPLPLFHLVGNKVLFLGVQKGRPAINGEPVWSGYLDTLYKIVLLGLIWVGMVLAQGFIFVYIALWGCLHLILWAPLFLLGFILFQMKILAVGRVYNWWFSVWTQDREYDTDKSVQIYLLQQSLLVEFSCETIPQLSVQVANSVGVGDFPPVAIFSVAMSAALALEGLYKYGYYMLFRGYPLELVPLNSFGGFIKADFIEEAAERKSETSKAIVVHGHVRDKHLLRLRALGPQGMETLREEVLAMIADDIKKNVGRSLAALLEEKGVLFPNGSSAMKDFSPSDLLKLGDKLASQRKRRKVKEYLYMLKLQQTDEMARKPLSAEEYEEASRTGALKSLTSLQGGTLANSEVADSDSESTSMAGRLRKFAQVFTGKTTEPDEGKNKNAAPEQSPLLAPLLSETDVEGSKRLLLSDGAVPDTRSSIMAAQTENAAPQSFLSSILSPAPAAQWPGGTKKKKQRKLFNFASTSPLSPPPESQSLPAEFIDLEGRESTSEAQALLNPTRSDEDTETENPIRVSPGSSSSSSAGDDDSN